MRYQIKHELENLAHTLNDLSEIHEHNKNTIERIKNIEERLGMRISLLKDRIDRIAIESSKSPVIVDDNKPLLDRSNPGSLP